MSHWLACAKRSRMDYPYYLIGGESVAGGKMKEIGTTHWSSPNTGADNSSGFTALPGGYRGAGGGSGTMGSSGYYWSTLETTGTYAMDRQLTYNFASVAGIPTIRRVDFLFVASGIKWQPEQFHKVQLRLKCASYSIFLKFIS